MYDDDDYDDDEQHSLINRHPLTGLIDGEYDRPDEEYSRPSRHIHLSKLPGKDWFNAAGAALHADRLPVPGSRASRVALVPEPGNPWHSRAVCVEKAGKRVGYMPARLADLLHDHIRYLNDLGLEVVTSARVTWGNEWTDDVFALEVDFPSFDLHDIFVEWTGIYSLNKVAIACMPVDEQEPFVKFARYGYSEFRDPLPEEVVERFFNIRKQLIGSLADAKTIEGDEEFVKNGRGYFSTLRAAVGTEENREVRIAAIVRLVRKALAVRLVETNMKKVEVAKVLEVHPSTVNRYLKEVAGREKLPSDQERKVPATIRLGTEDLRQAETAVAEALQNRDWLKSDYPIHTRNFEATASGALVYVEACEYATLLSKCGYSSTEIATALKSPVSLVAQLISDLGFYHEPRSDPQRFTNVQRIREIITSPNPRFDYFDDDQLEMALIDHESISMLSLRPQRHWIYSIVEKVERLLD